MKHKLFARIHIMLAASFLLSIIILFGGGLIEKETESAINLVINLSVTMAGFGLVAFQIARASNELKDDFLECSIFMFISTILGFFYLVYPSKTLVGFNFGEASIFMFFWGFILFLVVLIDKRLKFLN